MCATDKGGDHERGVKADLPSHHHAFRVDEKHGAEAEEEKKIGFVANIGRSLVQKLSNYL